MRSRLSPPSVLTDPPGSSIDDLRSFEKEGLISEDDMHDGLDRMQKLTDKYVEEVDDAGKRKETEIMEV